MRGLEHINFRLPVCHGDLWAVPRTCAQACTLVETKYLILLFDGESHPVRATSVGRIHHKARGPTDQEECRSRDAHTLEVGADLEARGSRPCAAVELCGLLEAHQFSSVSPRSPHAALFTGWCGPEHAIRMRLHPAACGGVVRRLVEAVTALLDRRERTRTRGRKTAQTPLHWAAWSATGEAVTALLEAGADPNARDVDPDLTPLHCGGVVRDW